MSSIQFELGEISEIRRQGNAQGSKATLSLCSMVLRWLGNSRIHPRVSQIQPHSLDQRVDLLPVEHPFVANVEHPIDLNLTIAQNWNRLFFHLRRPYIEHWGRSDGTPSKGFFKSETW